MENLKRKLLVGILGVGMACFSGFIAPVSVNAAYTDSSSIAYEGFRNGYDYYSATVIDDDGTSYTFDYRGMPRTDDLAYRIYGNYTWQYFHVDPPHSHIDNLASTGWQSIQKKIQEGTL